MPTGFYEGGISKDHDGAEISALMPLEQRESSWMKTAVCRAPTVLACTLGSGTPLAPPSLRTATLGNHNTTQPGLPRGLGRGSVMGEVTACGPGAVLG